MSRPPEFSLGGVLDSDHIGLLLAIAMVWAVPLITAVVVERRDQRAPADDIGLMWLLVLALYAGLPPLTWLIQGGHYTAAADNRLFLMQPTTEEVSALVYIGLAYSCSFAASYLILRGSAQRAIAGAHVHGRVSTDQMMAALVIVIIFKATILIIGLAGFVRSAESYIDSYKAIAELPVAARQALKISGGISAVAQLVLLVAILQRWPKQRFLFGVYLAMVLLSFDAEGSRAATLIGLIGVAIAWHVVVRPIRARSWVIAGVIGLLVFIALGYRRTLGSWADVDRLASDSVGLGEFDTLWANGVELFRSKNTGHLLVPDAARYGELWSIVPSQLLWFDKDQLAEWYVRSYYPSHAFLGGGLGFGSIPQAVIGYGLYEAVVRGLALGAIAAWTTRWYQRPSPAWWRLPLFLYLLTTSYVSIRDSTFRPVDELIQLGIPGLLVVSLLARLLARRSTATR